MRLSQGNEVKKTAESGSAPEELNAKFASPGKLSLEGLPVQTLSDAEHEIFLKFSDRNFQVGEGHWVP